MKERIVDREISLIPYYPNSGVALVWYQDLDVSRQVDNIDHVYTLDRLNNMYTYLSTHGECYYIRHRDEFVGDVSLRDNGEVRLGYGKKAICRNRAAGSDVRCLPRRA